MVALRRLFFFCLVTITVHHNLEPDARARCWSAQTNSNFYCLFRLLLFNVFTLENSISFDVCGKCGLFLGIAVRLNAFMFASSVAEHTDTVCWENSRLLRIALVQSLYINISVHIHEMRVKLGCCWLWHRNSTFHGVTVMDHSIPICPTLPMPTHIYVKHVAIPFHIQIIIKMISVYPKNRNQKMCAVTSDPMLWNLKYL